MLMDLLLLGRHDPWKARCRYEILREETLKSRIVTQKKDKVFVAFSFPVTSRNSDELKPGLGKQLGRQTRDQRGAHHRHRSPRRGVFFFDPMIYYIIEFHGIVHRTRETWRAPAYGTELRPRRTVRWSEPPRHPGGAIRVTPTPSRSRRATPATTHRLLGRATLPLLLRQAS
jgi:hypothetical protein